MLHMGPKWNIYLSLYQANFENKILTFKLGFVVILFGYKIHEDEKIEIMNM